MSLIQDYFKFKGWKYIKIQAIQHHESAFDFFNWWLRQQGFEIVASPQPHSKGRHKLYIVASKLNPAIVKSFYVVFKRDWYHSFNSAFPSFIDKHPECKGYGESLDTEYLDIALIHNSIIVFIHPDNAYFIDSVLMDLYCINHKLYRQQDKENIYKKGNYTKEVKAEQEQTYCIPISLLQNLEGWKI